MEILASTNKIINIGYVGEHLATKVVFNISKWIEKYGVGTVNLVVEQNGQTYPQLTTFSDEKVTWLVTNSNTAMAGAGRCELTYSVGDIVVKSAIYNINVFNSISGNEEEAPPSYQSWIDEIIGGAIIIQEALPTINQALSNIEGIEISVINIKNAAVEAQGLSETAQSKSETAADTATAKASEASASATVATNAKATAEASKTAAALSEANALSYKNTAVTQATNAGNSASAAATSATNAATSATNAASSASSASGSKADALASKNAAATSASNAATSETKAKTSETNAKTAETGAIAAKTAAESAKSIAVTAKDNAVLAKTDAETAQGLAETAKSGADAAKSGADMAKAGAESARDTAITAKNDAVTAKNAAQSAKTAAETAKGQAETARSGAQTSATTAGNKALDSEAFGAGTRNGVAVTSGDSAYQNNAKWYKDQASGIVGGDFSTKTEAQGYANTAQANAKTYTDAQIAAIPPIDISGKADKTYVDNKVKTDVPLNAKFTDTIYTHPSSHPASMITGLPTSLPANGGNADTSRHLIGDDTRNVDSSPSVYMSGGSRYVNRAGWQTEFKNVSTIGLTGLLNGTYCYLQTHTPWSDPSGGYPIQVAYGNGTPCWRVGVSTTSWGAWKKMSDGGNANTVNGFTVGVNVPANAKFTDNDTITTINGKTGAIEKADIVALGIPAQDTVVDISGKADKTYVDDKVKTDVPVGAKFTDTVYSHPPTHPASMITDLPTKLSELQNDIGAGAELNIVTSAIEPTLNTGDQWHKEI